MTDQQFSTPMMQQYAQIKQEYADCLLFYRLGDFYELFLEDAKIGAEVLNIVLTNRPRGKDGDIPMAGVPFHAADSYIAKLVRAGHKVAICEQVSQPNGKGIVEREVIRIVTPGTILDEKNLSQKENNYLVSFTFDDKFFGLAAVDISTGDFFASQSPIDQFENQLLHHLSHLNPSECILSPDIYNQPNILKLVRSLAHITIYCFQDWSSYAKQAQTNLKKHFNVTTLKAFNLENQQQAQQASAALLGYLRYTQKKDAAHIRTIKPLSAEKSLHLDQVSIRNLELFSTLRNHQKHGSLLTLIDKTKTAMGGRLLKKWLLKPLTDQQQIESRLNQVEFFYNHQQLRTQIRDVLSQINDIERTLSRLSLGVGNPRDLIQLKESLKNYNLLVNLLKKHQEVKLLTSINQSKKIIQLIESHIVANPPVDPKQGNLIKPNIESTLDELQQKISNSKNWIVQLEEQERKKTGITSLKVKFNKVFGYYIDVSKANLDKVPDHYQRKQTLVNSERFITPKLKQHEEIILSAQEVTHNLEYQIFLKVVAEVISFTSHLQAVAQSVATIDCLTNLSQIAYLYRYTKPALNQSGIIEISNGRHPVIEQLIENQQFVPNNIVLNQSDHQLLIITGPNMAGKSVLMRQVALITLLAHMGSFVPAQKANISLTDRIFVRSGASDMISSGLSTFMVEMVETATILNQATDHSLIIMDEIGRGTSTYDGISIAWSVAEALVTNPNRKPKTLFATHYHELQALEETYPNCIKNYAMAVQETSDHPVFLHKLTRGSADHSFGIEVAKMAGLPTQITDKATRLLKKLSQSKHTTKVATKTVKTTSKLERKLESIDTNKITPLEALTILTELQTSCQS